MDPVACVENMLTAMLSGDRETAQHCCEALASWLDNDGYLPSRLELLDVVHVTKRRIINA